MKAAVIGLGVEGKKAVNSLLKHGWDVYASDLNSNIEFSEYIDKIKSSKTYSKLHLNNLRRDVPGPVGCPFYEVEGEIEPENKALLNFYNEVNDKYNLIGSFIYHSCGNIVFCLSETKEKNHWKPDFNENDVKDNFLVDRVFSNITDLNWQALDWCNYQNNLYHRATASVPQQVHMTNCAVQLHELPKTDAIRFYLCPERKISFDGFVNYEGRRFGVPYSYSGKTARISRSGDTLYIYSADLRLLLVTHNVTWSRKDSFCEGQYEDFPQPEEFPTMSVKAQILRLPKSQSNLSFAKFDFDEEDPV